jgi:hypothetical protein
MNKPGRQGHLAEGVPRHAHADGLARLGLAGEEVHALLGHRLACVQDQRVLQHHISTIQSALNGRTTMPVNVRTHARSEH